VGNINLFVFAGNLAREPILGKTEGGTPKTFYTVAVDDTRYDKDGGKKDKCDFIPITTYGRQAENDARYLKKGAPVIIQCKVHSWWNPDTGKSGFSFEVVHVQYMGKSSGSTSTGTNETAPPPADMPPPEMDDWDRDYQAALEAEQEAANAITPPRRGRN
jgi:single-strand DNA-binding protein